MRAANLSKECSEENPLTHSTHFVQQAIKPSTQPRSQLCDLTYMSTKGHNVIPHVVIQSITSQQLKQYCD